MLTQLPIKNNFKNIKIFEKLIKAHKALANLKGISKIIPNESIIINSLALQEAKDSSEIENIITTHDELYLSWVNKNNTSAKAKEVQNYKEALLFGFDIVKKNDLLLIKDILKIQEILEWNDAWIRTQMGTVLKNDATGEIIYTPPQTKEEIVDLLANLEQYINTDIDENDPLIKMAITHFQFESIHPFYDWNGRTGRIINILYLVLSDLLDLPILYLSWFITKNKWEYYSLFQEVREDDNWEWWILYMLEAIEKTSIETINKINWISELMQDAKKELKAKLPKIYSKDLIEILFSHPYTKIEFLVESLNITRKTASKYLKELENIGFVEVSTKWKSKFYINIKLFELLKKEYNL